MLATLVEGDQKAPFSIATTRRCRRGCYSFPWYTLPLICTLYCWVLSKAVSSTIFKVYGMTRTGIKPRSPGPLANTLTTRPMSRLYLISYIVAYKYWISYTVAYKYLISYTVAYKYLISYTVAYKYLIYIVAYKYLISYTVAYKYLISSSSSSSSSSRAASTDIPDPLFPRLPIIHRHRQVFGVTSRIIT